MLYAYVAPALSEPDVPFADTATPAGEPLDLRTYLSTATVHQGARQCTAWTGNRWICGPKPWLWVGSYRGRVSAPQGPKWRSCIWAHPTAKSRKAVPLRITLPGVELQRELFGEVALLDVPRSGEPVDFEVAIDGKRVHRNTLRDDRGPRDWRQWTARTPGGRHDVTFTVSTRKPDWRHVCFTALTGREASP